MKNNIISIITPSYNQGQYIEETIQSVLLQEGDFFIDYIIADGGSTDNSVSIIKKYDELLKNRDYPIKCRGIEFRWWSKKDSGQTNALNNGFKIAKGNILGWINSDDFYEPGVFKKVFDVFHSHSDLALIYGDGYNVYSSNEKKLVSVPKTSFDELIKTGNVIFQPSVFFTKQIIKEVGYLDEDMQYAFDFDLWVKIAKIGKIHHLNQILANFRIWESSKTTLYQDRFSKERKIILKRYNGRRIDPKSIYYIKSKIIFQKYIYEKMPRFYYFSKKIFYKILDAFPYK